LNRVGTSGRGSLTKYMLSKGEVDGWERLLYKFGWGTINEL